MQLSTVVKGLRYALAASVLVSLVACSSLSKKDGIEDDDALPNAGDESYSLGAGDQEGFGQRKKNHMRAPENQTYYFEYDRSQFNEEDRPYLDLQAKYLVRHPNARVVLEGNTDERGSREYNIGLGERRALAVADLLKMSGVAEKQIRVVSYGEEKPAADGHNEEAYRLNRRVELVYEEK